MNAIIEWFAAHARTTLVLVVLVILTGSVSYITLPKESDPDIAIPVISVMIPAPGISAEDSESLILKPLETRLSSIDGLDEIYGTAAEGYGAISLAFDYNWDKNAVLAEIRDEMSQAEATLPEIVDGYTISEINFSEFPISVISISGNVPERSLVKIAKEVQDRMEAIPGVLRADLVGARDEIVEAEISLEALETYNLEANELIAAVSTNNALIPAGSVVSGTGRFSIKIPSNFTELKNIYDLPLRANGDSVIRLGDIATIKRKFEDAESIARYNGESTLAVQILKTKEANLIDVSNRVRVELDLLKAQWPQYVRASVATHVTMEQSTFVEDMLKQLEGSVLTAVMLVALSMMMVLGFRPALLVALSIPISFLLTFTILGILGVTISTIVMFGLILSVGMLVDTAIIVIEYADHEEKRGIGPMHAYLSAAKRMFWPVASSTATTLAAFLPLLFWPGVAGQFMQNLPRTVIVVLTSSIIVGFLFIPILGGVLGRLARRIDRASDRMRTTHGPQKLGRLYVLSLVGIFLALQLLVLGFVLLGLVLFAVMTRLFLLVSRARRPKEESEAQLEQEVYVRKPVGRIVEYLISSPRHIFAAFGSIIVIIFLVVVGFGLFAKPVEFFPKSEPEMLNVYVRARGNLSVEEQTRLSIVVEEKIREIKGVENVYTFSGTGGLSQNTGGGEEPVDKIGIIQIELIDWKERYAYPDDTGRGASILDEIKKKTAEISGIKIDIIDLSGGPAAVYPISFRLLSDDPKALDEALVRVRAKMMDIGSITKIEDTSALPGIDWRVDIDTTLAGRYMANVQNTGAMIMLATRGLVLGKLTFEGEEDEADIIARFPKSDRLISTLERLKVATPMGQIPISNYTTIRPVSATGTISRFNQDQTIKINADIAPGADPTALLAGLNDWAREGGLPSGVRLEPAGNFADQSESMAFLQKAFAASLGMMLLILLMQFNSFYRSFLILLAVVFSFVGVLLGLLITGQAFTIIMTGMGLLALAGIIVNNNIILIDSIREYEKKYDYFEAIIRTVETRIRPIFLTVGTTTLGVLPMMFGVSIDFIGGEYSINSPTTIIWKPLAMTLVFGLTFGSILTLIVTPILLALPVWIRREAHLFPQWVKDKVGMLKSRLGLGLR